MGSKFDGMTSEERNEYFRNMENAEVLKQRLIFIGLIIATPILVWVVFFSGNLSALALGPLLLFAHFILLAMKGYDQVRSWRDDRITKQIIKESRS